MKNNINSNETSLHFFVFITSHVCFHFRRADICTFAHTHAHTNTQKSFVCLEIKVLMEIFICFLENLSAKLFGSAFLNQTG